LQHIDERLSLSQPYGSLEMTPELGEIVAAWPDLPEAIKAGIVAMVEAAASASRNQPAAERTHLV
jgi:hypothetical protein